MTAGARIKLMLLLVSWLVKSKVVDMRFAKFIVIRGHCTEYFIILSIKWVQDQPEIPSQLKGNLDYIRKPYLKKLTTN
jgi:hypothetical protein